MAWKGALCGLAAAATFGASAPIAKALLPNTGPVVLAGLLYLGAGLALTIARRARPIGSEARLDRADVPLLLVVIVTGGVLGPILMLLGLERVSGVTGALLLNLEAPLTMLIAVGIFGEHLGRRDTMAAALIVIGGAVLVGRPTADAGSIVGALCLTAACSSWAFDNNATQRLSIKDPIAIVRVKALGAAFGTFTIAFAMAAPLPPASVVLPAMRLGAGSYGLSIVLDAYALRMVGAAREAAYFATTCTSTTTIIPTTMPAAWLPGRRTRTCTLTSQSCTITRTSRMRIIDIDTESEMLLGARSNRQAARPMSKPRRESGLAATSRLTEWSHPTAS